MNRDFVKQRLLETDCFYDNDWLDKYIDLIIDNQLDQHIGGYSESHHIIPRFYYVRRDLDVDNSDDNLVEIPFKIHLLAHAYLAYASKDRPLYYSNCSAFDFMVHNKFKISQINDEEFLNQLDELQEEYGRVSLKGVPKLDSTKEKLGNLRWCHQGNKEKHYYQGEPIPDGWLPGRCELHAERSKKSNTGRIWMNNGVDQHQVRPEDLQLYQNQGYTRGMLDRGDEWRSKAGKYPRTPEMIQNVITKRNQLFREHPERMSSTIFKKGQPGTIKGKKSITDGVKNRFIYPDEPLPEGWRYGSTQKWHQKSNE